MLLTSKDKDFIVQNYPSLVIKSDNLVEWFIFFDAYYDTRIKKLILNWGWGNYMHVRYKIKIEFLENRFPKVFEINWDLKRGFDYHVYDNWGFCLTHTLFEKRYKNKDFWFILKTFIIPFLYNQKHNEEKGAFLWEYWHFFKWTFEYLNENILSKDDYLDVLKSIKTSLWGDKKAFLYSDKEKERLINILKLESSESKYWFEKFTKYVKKNIKLFTKI